MAAKIAEAMRDDAYAASVDLAREKGAFPLLDTDQYLAAPRFASRLPDSIKRDIRAHGLRNSQISVLAPTGTMSGPGTVVPGPKPQDGTHLLAPAIVGHADHRRLQH